MSDLKGDVMPELKSDPNNPKTKTHDRASAENRSDADSGIDDREYRDRRAQNMV